MEIKYIFDNNQRWVQEKIKTDKDGNYTGSLQGLNYGLKEAPSDLYRIQQYILEKSKSK